MKKCSKCKEVKELVEFYSNKANRDGLGSYCKMCQTENARKWRINNPKKARDSKRKWRINNPDYHPPSPRKDRGDYHKIYYANNKEKCLEASKKWRDANPEKCKEIYRIYYANNLEKRKEYYRNWCANNLDKLREKQQRRRALMAQLPATLTTYDWEETLYIYDYSCFYCGKDQDELDSTIQQEHIIPPIKGGGYTPDNIVPACRSCNSSKGNKSYSEYISTFTDKQMQTHLLQIKCIKDNIQSYLEEAEGMRLGAIEQFGGALNDRV